MNKRTYNPLNEGYSGHNKIEKGHTGSQGTAPVSLPKIQSAITKPSSKKSK